MVKIKHFQHRIILETDFLSNEGENEVRFLSEERNFQAYSLPIGRILEIYFARNERKSHANFCQNGRKSCLHIYEAGQEYPPLPPGRAATEYYMRIRLDDEIKMFIALENISFYAPFHS